MKKGNPKLQSNSDSGQKMYFYNEYDLARIIMLQVKGKVAASVLNFININQKLDNLKGHNLINKFSCPYAMIINATGQEKSSIHRAVNSLVQSKVLLKNSDGSLSWNLQGIDYSFDLHRKNLELKKKKEAEQSKIKPEKSIINPLQLIANAKLYNN